jgi:D-glycero-alpha-D-manno-heptose 1-phosphate guanylyltransferase
VEEKKRFMTTILLCGGLGTRLRNVVSDVPKVMAPINGKPFLEYLINYIRKFNVGEIILSVGYKANIIKDYFGSSVLYAEESTPLGTAGAVSLCKNFLKAESSEFLLINGDTFFAIDIDELFRKHRETNANISLALARVKDTQRYARVLIDKNNKVIRIEKGLEGPGLITGGIFVFKKEMLEYFPEKGSLEEDVIAKFIDGTTYGFPFNDYFVDIGIEKDYKSCMTYLPKF